jgi:uncharacterized protein (TIGR00255 family)
MIRSMTGFAHKTCTISSASSSEQATISLSIKTLNSRFLETTVKFPSVLSFLETAVIKLCKEKLQRGHVLVTGYINNQAFFESSLSPSFSIIDGYVTAANAIKDRYSISGELTLDTVMQLPNIFVKGEQMVDQETTQAILHAVSEILDKVREEREIEGLQLKADLLNRISTINHEMNSVTERAKIFLEEQKQKIHTILQEIGTEENLLVNAQKNSFYSLLDKIDIHEEIVRLKSHLELFSICLHSTEAEKGKRMDFTLQELGREINTIAAKCCDAVISSHAINIKVEIEKMREQAQNIV